MRYDLAIVGSGGAAFAAAIAARRRGLATVMVERATLGGTCVNTGCVPSKALLAAAEARQVAVDRRFPGITTGAGPVDVAALMGAKRDLVEALRAEKYVDVAVAYGFRIVRGTARFVGDAEAPALEVASADGGAGGETVRVEAAHYVVATGSTPSAPPIDGLADAGYLTSTTAMELDELPASMVVIGGGAVGLEQAQLFARLGVEVTIVEVLDRLAPSEEPEISRALAGILADDGIEVVTGAAITSVRRDGRREGGGYRVIVDAGGETLRLSAEQLLAATGRRPVTDRLGLDAVGVKTDEAGAVVVDEYLRSANPRIWAAGDVTGDPQFVYVAAAHGALVVDNAFEGAGRTVDYTHLPRVTFTSPAVAAVGLTDAQAARQGLDCESRVLPLEYLPRAIVNRDTRGLVKLVAERGTGRLRGVHLLAEGAGDVILAGVYAIRSGMTVADIADTWSPYLTTAEALKLAAQTFTRDVTKLSCCAT
ncbi:MAG: mercury(II) reductase [Streptosporangiales bacterium]|nr:mercury(II) reductase [Streptosporangiales bacterium]